MKRLLKASTITNISTDYNRGTLVVSFQIDNKHYEIIYEWGSGVYVTLENEPIYDDYDDLDPRLNIICDYVEDFTDHWSMAPESLPKDDLENLVQYITRL